MTDMYAVQAKTSLSPEWDHGFDEVFTELITGDPDWVREEFDALIGANFTEPPAPPAPPAQTDNHAAPDPSPAAPGRNTPDEPPYRIPTDPAATQRSPP